LNGQSEPRGSYFSELCLMYWTYSSARSKSLRDVVGSVI
jgi:hypothetical protein